MSISVGLLSDTHGFLPDALLQHFAGLPVLHAGDIGTRNVLDLLGAVCTLHAVRGNVDGGDFCDLPMSRCVELGGKRIALIHNAGWPQRPNPLALELIAAQRADVLVFGHTHVPLVDRRLNRAKSDEWPTLWLNPGACGNLGHHQERSAALLHLDDDGSVRLERILLGPRFSSV